jgi:hypothetical protein
VTFVKRRKDTHRCGMGARHLDQEGGFDLISGLCGLDESQAGAHGHLGLPPGSLAAAISCIREQYTKSLEAVPNAFFNLCHHSRFCPSGG